MGATGQNPGSPGFALPRDEAEQVRRARDIEREIEEMLADGTLRALIDSLPASIAAIIATAVNTITLGVSGNATVGGTLGVTGRSTLTGGVTSADVKSRTLSVSYDAVYIDVNNIMGKSPSALRFKQDLEKYNFDPNIVDLMQGFTFRLIGAVEALGEAAPREHGYIADYLDAVGLGMFVRRDEDGQFSGLAYERLVMVAIDSLKDARRIIRAQQREIAEMKADIAAIKGKLGL